MHFHHKAKSMNPFTGEMLSEHKYFTEEEIIKRIEDSWKAFMVFKKTDLSTRVNMLNKLANTMEKHMDKLAKTITLEIGKPIIESRKEVTKSVKLIRHYVQHSEEYMKTDGLTLESAKLAYVLYEPLGPIYHMRAYNYPLYQGMRRTIPAMLMGNTIINRSSSMTIQTGMLIEEIFREAGFTNGELFNLIMAPEQSELVISHPLIRGVSYIGSQRGGHEIGSLAGKYSKKLVTELGSNDAFIVMKDADIDMAVDKAMGSRLKDAGQSGISAKSFLIDEIVYDKFKDKLLEKMKMVKMGDPMDQNTTLGPLIKKEDLEKSLHQIKKAQDQGAKLLYGGEQPKDEKLKKGLFLMPTLLEVSEGNILLQEETFAPIFTLMKFTSEKDVIRMANNKNLGFASAIFTKDENKAQMMARELETGAVFINTKPHFHPGVPMGGVKGSGVGRDGGIWGVREFSTTKAIFLSKMKGESMKSMQF